MTDSPTPYDVLGKFPDLHRGLGTGPLNGLSMRDLLRAIKYRDLRASLETAALAAHLQAHPDRVRAWQDYSEDKRTDGGFYLDVVGCEVGRYERGKGRHDRTTYSSPHETCAAFVVKELDYWLEAAPDTITFSVAARAGMAPHIDVLINGTTLENRVEPGHGWIGIGPWEGLPPSRRFFGEADRIDGDEEGRVVVLLCAGDSQPQCDDLLCRIEVRDSEVVWSSFHDRKSLIEGVGPFRFSRGQYEKALREAGQAHERESNSDAPRVP